MQLFRHKGSAARLTIRCFSLSTAPPTGPLAGHMWHPKPQVAWFWIGASTIHFQYLIVTAGLDRLDEFYSIILIHQPLWGFINLKCCPLLQKESVAEGDGFIERHPLLSLTLWRPVKQQPTQSLRNTENVFCHSLWHQRFPEFFPNTTNHQVGFFFLMYRLTFPSTYSRRHKVIVNY